MTSDDEQIEKIVELAREGASLIKKQDFIRLISHNDSDGITSAAILIQALNRIDIPFHASIVSRLNESVVNDVNNSIKENDLVIFCDMGSGQPELIKQINTDVLVIDHHQPVGNSPSKVMVNPHMAGIEGSYYLSASGTTYLVCKELSSDNIDLAGLAITGAIGDKQLFESANATILKEAIENNVISIQKGLKVGSGEIGDVLENTLEPFLDITGDREKINKFLDFLNLSGDISELSYEDMKKLTSSIALKLAKRASPEAVDAVIGEIYYLNNEVVPNVYDLVSILDTCGKQDKSSLAIALCLRDKSVVQEASAVTKESQKRIIQEIKECESLVKDMENIKYLQAENLDSIGSISGIMVRYLYPNKPFIGMNETEGIVKVSGRATRSLIGKGVDLATAFRDAATNVGGNGGGHSIASGATIPPGKQEEFVTKVNEIVGIQTK